MRAQRLARPSLLLVLLLAGCSSTGGTKLGSKNTARSLAVVGDRPLPSSVGDPGDQVAADVVEPEPRRNPLARISGRVVDDRGRPVPDATVRLADGGQQGGRDSKTTTDRSGAFTLGGLRPGSDYVIVAEADGDGTTQTGRVRAKTADTGVVINLSADEDASPAKRPAGRGPRTRPISSRETTDDPEVGQSSRINLEDLGSAAADETQPDSQPRRSAMSNTARLSPPISPAGWRKVGAGPMPADRDDSQEGSPPAPIRKRSSAEAPPMDDDGPNPLPPAIETAGDGHDQASNVSGRPDRSSSDKGSVNREAGSIVLAAAATLTVEGSSSNRPARPAKSPDTAARVLAMPAIGTENSDGSTPEAIASTARVSSPAGENSAGIQSTGQGSDRTLEVTDSDLKLPTPGSRSSPPSMPSLDQGGAIENPAARPVFASQRTENPAPDSNAAYDPFALAAASTDPASKSLELESMPPKPEASGPARPSELEAEPSAPPAKKWGDLTDRDRPKILVEPTKATSTSLLRRLRGTATPTPKAAPVMLCDYDSRHRKVADFQLPDLEGKPVRLRDLDSDFVLLDFWGTWCKPCLDSIPHLIELQKKHGPSKLRVVGIACEQAGEADRAARVSEYSRRLGINYTVLVSNMDGTCPVQNALQIQFYPTMILLDRQGQILWRDRGATPATLDRLDRVLDTRSSANIARR